MDQKEALIQFLLRRADDTHILGHRLGEWCGHGPVLEEDLALSNVALDLIGQARNYLTYAGGLEGKGRDEDDLAFLRNERQYVNCKLVEQPNGDYAHTIVRGFLFDAWHLPYQEALANSGDATIAAIAAKAVKEVTYHLKRDSEWLVRFGDGTEESHRRAQEALDHLWTYTGELFEEDAVHQALVKAGIAPAMAAIKAAFDATVDRVLAEATLKRPADGFMATGGRQGKHSEHLGYILAEMQYLQRAYPGAEW
ncbi:MAG: phenylacetate-CoA oxygenase subunit PaaC [Flavobacteriales bacterium]|jgi:ring-1,2-phenylacetyl-CoA epoxidase subunit PaaC|nr:phenylacetate-CoA oxygenase subunit PaaC [Flavobacteriales bacterium]MBK7941301.1 phenylacetate-CoA oxygenase subunit PaaC [Flavobacteriales bacterium]